MAAASEQRVVVVTGGGGGIGAAIATELGRLGAFVVTVDPLVTVDGAAPLDAPEETTASRIVAAGGSAQASPISVTDREAVVGLFEQLVDERGRLDAVVNVAGITRPTTFAKGSEADWQAVLSVHLDGYRNVLEGALPIMAAAGRGRILGVTSGSGWRAADAGAYACAKRAVAALTWQVGRQAPPGVVVNAVSPIAVTRMVTAALARAGGAASAKPGGSSATGGLSLGSMPQPGDLAALGAHLVGPDLDWCTGNVVFAGGSEVAVIDRPRLLEVVRTEGADALAPLIETVVEGAFLPAESTQQAGGGSNPRFDDAYRAEAAQGAGAPSPAVGTCGVVAERPELRSSITAALEARGITCAEWPPTGAAEPGFAGAAVGVAALADQLGTLDAVVVARSDPAPPAGGGGWEQILAEHAGTAAQIHADAAWARAVADHAAATERPVRLITLVDASSAGGRSQAQAAAQLARASRRATADRVAAFAVAVEDPEATDVAAQLAAVLVTGQEVTALAGAELAVGAGWLGLRSHPQARGSIVLGSPELPPWFDDALREAIR